MKPVPYTEQDISRTATSLKEELKKSSKLAFIGPLGAGKTTLIKELLRQCGVKDVVTSPTFTYVNRYETDADIFQHFDLYRLNSAEQFLGAGFDEYLQSGHKVIIEWPEIIMSLLDKDTIVVTIDYDEYDPERRLISWRALGDINGQ